MARVGVIFGARGYRCVEAGGIEKGRRGSLEMLVAWGYADSSL